MKNHPKSSKIRPGLASSTGFFLPEDPVTLMKIPKTALKRPESPKKNMIFLKHP